MTKTPYDPVKDLAPISVVGTNPYVLVVHAGIPVRTLAELAAYARRQPDKLAYAAPVFGGLSHLSMLLFLKRAGLEMTPVSYKGGAAPLADVVAGHVSGGAIPSGSQLVTQKSVGPTPSVATPWQQATNGRWARSADRPVGWMHLRARQRMGGPRLGRHEAGAMRSSGVYSGPGSSDAALPPNAQSGQKGASSALWQSRRL
jgi:hypothetical protein